MSNTLGRSFKEALKKIDQNQNQIAIYDYCDGEDFKKLWPLGTNQLGKPHIIIVWDGRGWSDDRNENLLAPHLTPMDWALAFSIEVLGSNSATDTSIHIVDLTGEEHDKEWAMRMRHQLLVEMPWVKLYAPLTPEKDGKPVRIRRGYNPIVSPTSSNDGSPALLEALSDASKCPNLSGDALAREGTNEGNQQPEVSEETLEPTKSHGLYKLLRTLLRLKRSPIVPPDPGSNDSTLASSEETNEELQHTEPSGETLNPEASSDGNQQLKLNPSGETLKDAQTSDSRDRLINLARQWSASLTQSDDHHDVNNVIGPSILFRETPDSGSGESLVDALLTRLSWCDHDFKGVTAHQWNAACKVKQDLFGRYVDVYAVDDQLNAGWGRAVCWLLKEKGKNNVTLSDERFERLNDKKDTKVRIYGCPSPDPLIDFLENAEYAEYHQRDYNQQIKKSDQSAIQSAIPQIILLDLRLYTDPDRERENARRLLKKACYLLDKQGLAWEGIELDEIEKIKNWLDSPPSNPEEAARTRYKALLLLPRLLALALPLTPIILFSATSQAWVKGTLNPYQNIITSFEKPRVLSNPEAVESSIAALHEALDKAVKMMRLRLQLAHAQKAVKIADESRKDNGGLENYHIEIYADETLAIEEGITSGVAFCVFPSSEKADCLQNELKDRSNFLCNHNGIIQIFYPVGPFHPIKGGAASENDVKKIANLLEKCCIKESEKDCQFWSVVSTRMAEDEIGGAASLGTFPDSPLDSALRFNLEFSLFVLIPYFCENKSVKGVSVYLPTRNIPLEKTLAEDYVDGFDLDVKEAKIGTWPFGSGFPIVRGWLHEWGEDRPLNYNRIKKNRIKKIKMTILGDESIKIQAKKGDPRFLHCIADWACTASKKDKSGLRDWLKNEGIFPHWFVSTDEKPRTSSTDGKCKSHPWYEDDTKNALVLMQVLRASSNKNNKGQDSDVLRWLLRNTYISGCDDRLLNSEFCSQQRLILWALRDKLDDATGQSLHLLCA